MHNLSHLYVFRSDFVSLQSKVFKHGSCISTDLRCYHLLFLISSEDPFHKYPQPSASDIIKNILLLGEVISRIIMVEVGVIS